MACLTFLDFNVPDLLPEDLGKIKGAVLVPESLVLDLIDEPQFELSPHPEKKVVSEPVVIVIPTKVHKKETKKKGLF